MISQKRAVLGCWFTHVVPSLGSFGPRILQSIDLRQGLFWSKRPQPPVDEDEVPEVPEVPGDAIIALSLSDWLRLTISASDPQLQACIRMVMLSTTLAMLEAVNLLQQCESANNEVDGNDLGSGFTDLATGDPITHAQVIAISKLLRKSRGLPDDFLASHRLEHLLRGSRVYSTPPKPKEEPTSEYKTLMARLKHEEEARAYERMINPPLPVETFEQRFPNASNTKLFAGNQAQYDQDDDITYADVNRQMALIINILVSIVACSIALWLVASRWSIPRRLALSMGGSILVAVAEAVVYAGYLRRVGEAREKGKKQVEIKEIIQTWVIGRDETSSQQDEPVDIASTAATPPNSHFRQRKIKPIGVTYTGQ